MFNMIYIPLYPQLAKEELRDYFLCYGFLDPLTIQTGTL